jgi:hypothetical protein
MTPGEAESKRLKAVEFLRRIGNDDLAEEFAGMDARAYAEHKGAALIENPKKRRFYMARAKSRADLQAELDEANEYIEQLEGKLDDIVGIAADEIEEEGEDDDNGDDNPD